MSVTFSQLSKLGRQGNSMFQIAAVVGYARANRMDYFLPKWEYARHFKGDFKEVNHIHPMPRYSEKSFSYNKIPTYRNIDLYGYFQSEKYFKHCEKEIRRMFEPNDAIKGILDASPISANTCAIHVRRTDYLTLKEYHPSLPLEYYLKAIELMKADSYWIFSDDIEWCKENLKGENFQYIHSGNDLLDWFMMTQCDRFIIANSSYSFWASYLCSKEKRVIAPSKDKWFGINYNNNSVNDLYLDLWELV